MEGTEESESSRTEQNISSPSLDEQLKHICTEFKGQCKVLPGSGKFSKTVKLNPENHDLVINFQITDAYPSDTPVIAVRSEALSPEEVEDLTSFLNQSATSKSASGDVRTMEELVNMALDWLKEEDINLKARKTANVPNKFVGKRGKKSKRKDKSEKEDKPKKPPMKTAMDVVKRIQWDNRLPADQFLVGYIDRLEGLKEKYFNAFSWEDIASVDYTVLAIPKHRIQYFKYKSEIVWDKRIRLDNVFGSTGGKINIYDILAKDASENDAAERNDSIDGDDESSSRGNWRDTTNGDEAYGSDEYSDSYSDTDSDDDIEVTIGGAVGGLPTFMGGYDEDGNPLDEDLGEEGGQFDKYWRDKLRPNYFLALRITDDKLRDSLEEVQNYIIGNEPDLAECRIPKGAMHMTLTTVGLETPEKIENAAACLRDIKDELSGIVPKTKVLKVKGVGNFFNRVIYAKVESPPEFNELVEHLKMCLNEKGIDIRDYHEFVPHITLMKISRPVGRLTGKKYVSPWLYSCFSETELGEQQVNNIHLCAMVDDRQDDGFYISAGSHKL